LNQLGDRRWFAVAALLLVFLGGSNTILALAHPVDGVPGLAFVLAGLARLLALVVISVAALRIALGSPRRPWLPDGGFFLYFGLSLIGFVVVGLAAFLSVGLPHLQRILVFEMVGIVLLAPLSVWTVAAAVEKPLALSPGPRLRNLAAWLPSFLLWAVLLVLPLSTAHAMASLYLVLWAGQDGFWPLAAADAVVSTLVVLLTLALRVTAYRSVARG
jgi:hypothetical protein